MTAMPALDNLRRDLRAGLRALTRWPGFTAVAWDLGQTRVTALGTATVNH